MAFRRSGRLRRTTRTASPTSSISTSAIVLPCTAPRPVPVAGRWAGGRTVAPWPTTPPPANGSELDPTTTARCWCGSPAPTSPGITADLMTVLELVDAEVQDLEQVLVRGHLTLAAVLSSPGRARRARGDAGALRTPAGPRRRARPVSRPHRPRRARSTPSPCSATSSRPSSPPPNWAPIAGAVVAAGANIDRIVRLARYPVYRLRVPGPRGRPGGAAALPRARPRQHTASTSPSSPPGSNGGPSASWCWTSTRP